jgi:hypothetical protein
VQPYSLDITFSKPAVVTSTSGTSTSAEFIGDDRGRWLFTAVGADAYVNLGDSSVAAATTATGGFYFYIPSGQSMVVRLQPNQKFFRVISSGTGTLVRNKVGN